MFDKVHYVNSLSAERQRDRYAAIKEKIFVIIGRVCAMKSYRCKGDITFDHINGRDYNLKNVGGNKLKINLQEAKQGLLRPLCLYHNSSQGAKKGNRGFRNRNHCIKDKRKCFCSRCEKKSKRVTGVFSVKKTWVVHSHLAQAPHSY